MDDQPRRFRWELVGMMGMVLAFIPMLHSCAAQRTWPEWCAAWGIQNEARYTGLVGLGICLTAVALVTRLARTR